MGRIATQNGTRHEAATGQSHGASKECAIFRADYKSRGGPEATSQEAVFAARERMRIAHQAALEALGIAQKR